MLIAFLAMVAVTAILIVTDLDHFRIPNRILYPGTAICFVLLAAGDVFDPGAGSLVRAIAGAAIYFGLLLLVFVAARGEGFGFGDVKLAALLGMFSAFQAYRVLAWSLIITAVLGAIPAVVLLLMGKGQEGVDPLWSAPDSGRLVGDHLLHEPAVPEPTRSRRYHRSLMLRFLTAGESHGPGLVATVEGLPAGLPVSGEGLAAELARRRLGFGRGARMRVEEDQLEILAGVRHGQTLGSPVAVVVRNSEWPRWQEAMSAEPVEDSQEGRKLTAPRPGHADLAGMLKYNTRDARDILERASARETAARTVVGYLGKATAGRDRRQGAVARRRDREDRGPRGTPPSIRGPRFHRRFPGPLLLPGGGRRDDRRDRVGQSRPRHPGGGGRSSRLRPSGRHRQSCPLGPSPRCPDRACA